MATFGRNFVQNATQPAYLEGLFQVGQQIGGAPRRERKKQEVKMAQQGLFSAMQNAQTAAMAGNVDELKDISTGLQDLLTTVEDPTVRDSIGQGMGQISQLMVAAQPKYNTNQARALNGLRDKRSDLESEIETLNSQFDADEGNFEIAEKITQAENQLSTLSGQIEKLSSNADVLIEANTIDFNTRLASVANEIELQEKTDLYYALQMRGLPKDGERYASALKAAEKAGATGAVALDDAYRLEQEEANLRVQELRDTVGPLSDSEITEAKRLGVDYKSFSPSMTRQRMASLTSSMLEAKGNANIQANIAPGAVAGKAYAKLYLDEIKNKGATEPGFGIIKLPFYDDLEDRIDGMTPEERNEIFDLIPEGATYDQIMTTVQDALSKLFPDEFKDFKEIVPEFDRQVGFDALVRQIASDNPTLSRQQIEAAARNEIAKMSKAIKE
jgi:hypothetical protein